MIRWALPTFASIVVVATPPLQANSQANDQELHVINLSQPKTNGGKCTVRVDRPGKSVTLVLCTNEPTTWDVAFNPRTRVSKIILGGRQKSSIGQLAPNIEIVEAFAQLGRNRAPGKDKGGIGPARGPAEAPTVRFTGSERIESPLFKQLVRLLHELTGQEIASFLSPSQLEPNKPIEIVVDQVQNDPRLRSDFPRPVVTPDLPKHEFQALEHTISPRGLPINHIREFTLIGPSKTTPQVFSRDINALAIDPNTKTTYGITDQGVVEIDSLNDRLNRLAPGSDLPRMTSPSGITFDSKRNRLLVAAGPFYEYDLKTKKWFVWTKPTEGDTAAIAYHPNEDAVYCLTSDHGTWSLCKYDADGVLVNKVKLQEPLSIRVVSVPSTGGPKYQIIPTADSLIVLTTDAFNTGLSAATAKIHLETYIFLVNPRSGKVQLTWRSEG